VIEVSLSIYLQRAIRQTFLDDYLVIIWYAEYCTSIVQIFLGTRVDTQSQRALFYCTTLSILFLRYTYHSRQFWIPYTVLSLSENIFENIFFLLRCPRHVQNCSEWIPIGIVQLFP